MSSSTPSSIGSILLVAAIALVDADGRVLVQRRPPGKPLPGLWEFPGGKVEVGETPETALVRELEEELAIVVPPHNLTSAGFASEPYGDGRLLLLLYIARTWTGTPRALAASALRWVHPAELHALAMPPADRPLIGTLEALL